MAKELKIEVWCDVCLEHEWRRPADHVDVVVRFGAAAPMSLDLCAADFKELVQPLIDALAFGQEVEAPPAPKPKRDHNKASRSVGPFKCLVPDCQQMPLKHRDSLSQHLKLLHAMTLADYVERFGELQPVPPAELAALSIEAPCPLCGKMYSTELGHRWPIRALESHLIGAHLVRPARPSAKQEHDDDQEGA